MEYKSSFNEFDFFMSSHVWDDMERDITGWLEDVRDEMEGADDMVNVARAQGRADALRRVLQWPLIIQEALASEGGRK